MATKSRYYSCYPLVVEDDPAFRLLLSRAFERAGVPPGHVRMVGDGPSAVVALQASDPDALLRSGLPPSFIVLDQGLPGKSGLEVLEWIKERRPLAGVPVFLLTSSERPDHVSRAFELRADSYYIKPPVFEELQKIVDGMLGFWHTRLQRRPSRETLDPKAAPPAEA
ncbi:MAG TPA: response regulator [Planctomycetota bacterium]|nr:response regulator [Planctomycetota bacterium]